MGIVLGAIGGYLAMVIVVLGVVSAFGAAGVERVPLDKPVAELTFMEAGQYAVQPAWYNWVIVMISAVGAWLGGRSRSQA